MADLYDFHRRDEMALRDCERRYLSDEDHYDEDSEEDFPYDTEEEAYD